MSNTPKAVVRCNGCGGDCHIDDMYCRGCADGDTGIIVSKVTYDQQQAWARDALRLLGNVLLTREQGWRTDHSDEIRRHLTAPGAPDHE